jgi:hypothetical protein
VDIDGRSFPGALVVEIAGSRHADANDPAISRPDLRRVTPAAMAGGRPALGPGVTPSAPDPLADQEYDAVAETVGQQAGDRAGDAKGQILERRQAARRSAAQMRRDAPDHFHAHRREHQGAAKPRQERACEGHGGGERRP